MVIGLPCPPEVSGEKGRLVRANWSPPGLALNSPPTGYCCTRVASRARVAFEERGWIGLGRPGQGVPLPGLETSTGLQGGAPGPAAPRSGHGLGGLAREGPQSSLSSVPERSAH